MQKLSYRSRCFIKAAMVWIAILIMQYSVKGASNSAPLDFMTFIMGVFSCLYGLPSFLCRLLQCGLPFGCSEWIG